MAGRDPRRANPLEAQGAKFWGAAALQGGGLGIYGDFLFSDVNRFEGSLAVTLAGPLVDRANALRKLTVGNATKAARGEKTTFARDAADFAGRMTPWSSLWYTRTAWERVVMDQLRYATDPDAAGAFRRRVNTRRREYGQDYWWKPGETSPSHPPGAGAR